MTHLSYSNPPCGAMPAAPAVSGRRSGNSALSSPKVHVLIAAKRSSPQSSQVPTSAPGATWFIVLDQTLFGWPLEWKGNWMEVVR
jgi:hypothetical protein